MGVINRSWALCLVLAFLLASPAAAQTAGQSAAGQAPAKSQAVWSVEAKVKRLFDSHTSYEFANPYPPHQSPLSRLEFGLNSWWGGLEVSRWTPLWSVSLEAMRNLTSGVDGILADSDWSDEQATRMRDIYSESNLRLKPSYDVRASLDVSVAPWLGLPKGLDLRPVGGVRWQRFDLMAFDGTQWEIEPDGSVHTTPLPGDAIHFKQTYWHYFFGLRGQWQPLLRQHPGFTVSGQVDYAYVTGFNQDHHLLRAGNRITEESTTGHAWHAALALEAPLGREFFFGLEAEYMTIVTTGSHRLVNDAYGMDYTWDNLAKVWSQQCSVMATLRYCF
ncbi:MAG: omptin family outer membrane protease [Desulfarculus sp.]|nr:omptin family outer membrane protease [Pseudomonadota bacterium]MBU4599937.1 omptin family outer membrane protease [Pseudomonadota bacterium]MBV1714601.1 omptin family outer membrane protease [Desulfarculus sp.]MBV1740138.1 omptin family outer membrane protease [Desulfarculus sp.]